MASKQNLEYLRLCAESGDTMATQYAAIMIYNGKIISYGINKRNQRNGIASSKFSECPLFG